jgi:hypothetical protein
MMELVGGRELWLFTLRPVVQTGHSEPQRARCELWLDVSVGLMASKPGHLNKVAVFLFYHVLHIVVVVVKKNV